MVKNRAAQHEYDEHDRQAAKQRQKDSQSPAATRHIAAIQNDRGDSQDYSGSHAERPRPVSGPPKRCCHGLAIHAQTSCETGGCGFRSMDGTE